MPSNSKREPANELEYETPQKRIGFLSRVNPKATARSVVWKSFTMTILGAAFWGLCLWLRPNPKWQPTWLMFAMWLVIASLFGAIYEWQLPADSDEDDEPAK